MEDTSTVPEERQWQLDARAFLKEVVIHWAGIASTIFGCGAITFWSGLYPVTAAPLLGSVFSIASGIAFMVGCFRAWRNERRANRNARSELAAIPNISGHWVRQKYTVPGVLSLTLDGHKFSGTFKEGNCDHAIEGIYDSAKKQFDVRTERIDRANPSASRFVQLETYWLVGNDRIYFENPRNVNGEFESGILKRKDS